MNIPISILTAVFFIFYAAPSFADTEAALVKVHDGDTITAAYKSGKKFKVRFYGIDAPELSQPYGKEAKNHLESMIKGKKLTLHSEGADIYGRKLATVYADGRNINLQMVKDGYAWNYRKYSKSKKLMKAQEYAKRNQYGLWKQKKPKEPWVYRHEAKEEKNAGNKPLIKSPIEGVAICFNPENHKIKIRAESCPRGYITIMK